MTPARARRLVVAGAALVATEAALIGLGRTFGSTCAERAATLPGDEVVGRPTMQTDHAVTIAATPREVWPWLVQMGWGRGGWYTARWVDRAFFPRNGPSADRIVPELQSITLGDFIPDGAPETGCGFHVVGLDPERHLVLRSTSHLPRAARERADLDWTWTFRLTPLPGGRTRLHLRSRWTTRPWWVSATALLVIVPADLVMARDMLAGIRARAARRAVPTS
ncbi:SRPBCC family protein [Nocardioides sp. GY 10113]|uniref:SRPBCC family protein n=1 Tax=Nocardioides sp. GY 10113 TaxID=2569761 RepID=UPI0010A77BF4|nr:SRPBCC family protein [Nocardioides sp. GY 10113]TIC79245.1 SRPBCC family protein [Nocardioides sp. GY 10113]